MAQRRDDSPRAEGRETPYHPSKRTPLASPATRHASGTREPAPKLSHHFKGPSGMAATLGNSVGRCSNGGQDVSPPTLTRGIERRAVKPEVRTAGQPGKRFVYNRRFQRPPDSGGTRVMPGVANGLRHPFRFAFRSTIFIRIIVTRVRGRDLCPALPPCPWPSLWYGLPPRRAR